MPGGDRQVRLYFDEDVSAIAAAIVRARQFDVLLTRDAGLLGANDLAQLRFATANGRTLVTHNTRDFVRLARVFADSGEHHHGIIVATRRPAPDLASRIVRLLHSITPADIIDQLRYV
jgi:hypothetical protein